MITSSGAIRYTQMCVPRVSSMVGRILIARAGFLDGTLHRIIRMASVIKFTFMLHQVYHDGPLTGLFKLDSGVGWGQNKNRSSFYGSILQVCYPTDHYIRTLSCCDKTKEIIQSIQEKKNDGGLTLQDYRSGSTRSKYMIARYAVS